MVGEDIGLAELIELARSRWNWILVPALLSGLAAFAVFSTITPRVYSATSRLLVYPSLDTANQNGNPIELYSSLLRSEHIIQKTAERLTREGIPTGEDELVIGRNLRVGFPAKESIVALVAETTDPETAAATANAWAEVFLDEIKVMVGSTAPAAGSVLYGDLAPTRQQLKEQELARDEFLDQQQKLEDETWSAWSRRISTAKNKKVSALAEYRTRTRVLMDEAVKRNLSSASNSPAMLAKVQEIVSVRAQLAETPSILSLEKAAADETLTELLIEGRDADGFDTALVHQEVNPLYERLAVTALTVETELKQMAGAQLPEILKVLVELQNLQIERAAGLAALEEDLSHEIRVLLHQKSRALRAIARRSETTLAEYERGIEQLAGLESLLINRLNSTSISRLLDQVDLVSLAAPAVPNIEAKPRHLLAKTAAGAFLGGMLGLCFALFGLAQTPLSPTSTTYQNREDSEIQAA